MDEAKLLLLNILVKLRDALLNQMMKRRTVTQVTFRIPTYGADVQQRLVCRAVMFNKSMKTDIACLG